MRFLFAFVLLAALALPAAPQTPCVGGTAGGFACSDVNLLAQLTLAQLGAPPAGSCGPYTNLCIAEVWGWTDPQTGKEYVLQAAANGTVFVDISTPTAPVVVGRLPSAAGTTNWRTLRVYNDHVFVGSEGSGHGIQVFDLTRLRAATTPPVVFTQDARYTGVSNTHTLDINEATGFLYAVGTNTCGGGLHIVNIQNPVAPVQAGCFATDGYTHETQCLVYDGPDTDYTGRELCVTYQGSGSSTNAEISFVDVTNKSAPVLISSVDYPNAGYSHQGWFTDDKRHLLVNDEFDDASPGTRTIVMNVEDLDNPGFDFNYFGPLGTPAHNLYLVGGYAFLSNYTGGLHILEVLAGIDVNTFVEVGYFDTYPQGNDFDYAGQWMNFPFFASGVVAASDGRNGLFLLDPTGTAVAAEPQAPSTSVTLSEAGPNPARGSTTFNLTLGAPERVRAEAFDTLGRRVAVLHDGPLAAGTTRLTLDGARLPAGRYVVRVAGESFVESRRVAIVR